MEPKPGDLVRVRVWRHMPYEKTLGIVLSVRKKYAKTKTTCYMIFVAGSSDLYFEDEVVLVQELNL